MLDDLTPNPFALLRIGSHLVGAGVWLADQVRETRRARTMHRYASRHGLTYQDASYGLVDTFTGGALDRGSDQQARHILRGTVRDRDYLAFDHTSRHPISGDLISTEAVVYRRTVYRSVVAVPTGLAWTPRLEVAPENTLTRGLGVVRGNDIQMESDAFNRAFTVTCPDRKFATDILHPRTMTTILGIDPRVRLVLDRGHLYAVGDGPLDPGDLRMLAAALAVLVDQIPAFLRTDYTAPTANPGL